MPSSREVLVVDADPSHRQLIERPLLQAGYRVDAITHGEALGHISREDMNRYAAVVVAAVDPSATVTSRPRAGEYVLQCIAQLSPETLPRVVLLAPDQRSAATSPKSYRILVEPIEATQLLTAVRAMQR
ncbi:MAG TPA: hypothetical protein VF883_11185 [Thermoanaerobaculia bacterium]|jgi:CheY-like chemotaxis protein